MGQSKTDIIHEDMNLVINVRATRIPSRARLRAIYDIETMDRKLGIHDSLRDVKPTRGKKIARLAVVDEFLKYDAIIAHGASLGWRLALPGERDAFAQAGAEVFRRGYSVVDLGTKPDKGGVVSIFASPFDPNKPALAHFVTVQPNLPAVRILFIGDPV